MIKIFLTLLFGLVLIDGAYAQKTDSTIYYFKKSGEQVFLKDSADFYRVILLPDTNMKKALFRVHDYYPDGKIKMIATSINASVNLTLDGVCTDYFPDGKTKIRSQFQNGRLLDSVFYYYPNGKLYAILNLEELGFGHSDDSYHGYFPYVNYHYKIRIPELRDSIGNMLVKNGTGHVVIYDDDFKKILLQGDLKSNNKEGDWTGLIADSGKFVCTYRRDDFKSGVSYTNAGHQYPFKKFTVDPMFSDGEEAFLAYVKKNLQYPESVKKTNPKGIAKVNFYVETDGRVTDVTLTTGVLKSLDDELVRVVTSSPLWVPASRFGIPIRTKYTFRFNYNSVLW